MSVTRCDRDQHFRRSVRLRGYDYSQPGAYFVTMCTFQRACLFGRVVDGAVQLSPEGQIVHQAWADLAVTFPRLPVDAWVVMPNHVHGVLHLLDTPQGWSPRSPLSHAKPLGQLVGAFKTSATRSINAMRNSLGAPVWQRGYYEHIIRSEAEWQRIREYIAANPANWVKDDYYAELL